MNVYYLPSRSSTAPPPLESNWPSFRVRLRNAWWRVLLAVVEVRALLRRRPRYSEDSFEFPAPVVPALTRPAQVIDFDAARRRLRPATQS
jgi:hypothetical protein